jgi:hypothetical protein
VTAAGADFSGPDAAGAADEVVTTRLAKAEVRGTVSAAST